MLNSDKYQEIFRFLMILLSMMDIHIYAHIYYAHAIKKGEGHAIQNTGLFNQHPQPHIEQKREDRPADTEIIQVVDVVY